MMQNRDVVVVVKVNTLAFLSECLSLNHTYQYLPQSQSHNKI